MTANRNQNLEIHYPDTPPIIEENSGLSEDFFDSHQRNNYHYNPFFREMQFANQSSQFELSIIRDHSVHFNPTNYQINNQNSTVTANILNLNEDNHEVISHFLNRQKKKYGSLLIGTFRKLVKNKLTSISILSEYIYKRLLELFFKNFDRHHNILRKKTNLLKKKTNRDLNKLTSIINCLPSLKLIARTIKNIDFNSNIDANEIYFIKICLDLIQKYYSEFDSPMFKNYNKKVLVVMKAFYEKINQVTLDSINEKLTTNLLKKFDLVRLKTKFEYIEFIRNEKKRYISLYGGIEEKHFFN